tara:strand:+ start:857 stop:1009 length:153 start_codon:yes stop_codon:yes gene_type:complete
MNEKKNISKKLKQNFFYSNSFDLRPSFRLSVFLPYSALKEKLYKHITYTQ